jgi:hypothetical protein
LEKTIAMRIHANQNGSVLAAADAQLVGKTLTENKITFHVSKTFYHETLVSEEEFILRLNEAANVNLIGEITIAAAQKHGCVNAKHGKKIAGVPHAQIYRL